MRRISRTTARLSSSIDFDASRHSIRSRLRASRGSVRVTCGRASTSARRPRRPGREREQQPRQPARRRACGSAAGSAAGRCGRAARPGRRAARAAAAPTSSTGRRRRRTTGSAHGHPAGARSGPRRHQLAGLGDATPNRSRARSSSGRELGRVDQGDHHGEPLRPLTPRSASVIVRAGTPAASATKPRTASLICWWPARAVIGPAVTAASISSSRVGQPRAGHRRPAARARRRRPHQSTAT